MITLAYGVPGSGKSTLLHDLVSAQHKVHRFFVNDHEAGWGPDGFCWRGKPPKIHQVIERPEEMEPLFDKDPDEFEEAGVWVFRGIEGDDIAQLAAHVGDVAYVDDELDLLARRKGWDDSGLRQIVHQGRHVENGNGEFCRLHLFGACRRPQNLHTDVTDLADEVYLFRLQGRRTLERLVADSMIEDEDWDEVRNLENFNFIHWPSGKRLTVVPLTTQK